MKKRSPAKKKVYANSEIFVGKKMMLRGRICIVGYIGDGYVFVSFPGEREATHVHPLELSNVES